MFLNALLNDGKRVFDAIILDLVEESGAKICLWIPEWKQRVKMRAKLLERADSVWRIGTADESRILELVEGQSVKVECGLNLGERRWKNRLVLSIV
jgi:hypothetical protein